MVRLALLAGVWGLMMFATAVSALRLGEDADAAKWGFIKKIFRKKQEEKIDTNKVASGPYRSKRGTYNLHRVYSKKLDSLLSSPHGIKLAETNNAAIPDALKGLWWMEGNPAPEYLASFGKSEWKSGSCDKNGKCKGGCVTPNGINSPHPLKVPPKEDGTPEVCGGSLTIKCYDSHTWSWSDNLGGKAMYKGATTTCMELVFFFNAEITKAHIFPIGCTFVPFPMYFTLEATKDPANWLRRSHPWGTDHTTRFQFPYNLKQIVDGDGNPGKYWQEYVSSKKVGKTSLISTKESEETGWWLWG